MKRKFPSRPFVGVGAVILRRNSVLLIRRGQPPMRGEWTLPGGVVEVGETLHQALRREIKEETGLQIEVGPLLELFDRIVRKDNRVVFHYVIADFLGKRARGRLRAASDVSAARFVPRMELEDYHLTTIAKRTISRAFSLRQTRRTKRFSS